LNYTLTQHPNSNPYCGAVGPIAYREGQAWSVNSDHGEVMDWRFELTALHHGCKECERHIRRAAELHAEQSNKAQPPKFICQEEMLLAVTTVCNQFDNGLITRSEAVDRICFEVDDYLFKASKED